MAERVSCQSQYVHVPTSRTRFGGACVSLKSSKRELMAAPGSGNSPLRTRGRFILTQTLRGSAGVHRSLLARGACKHDDHSSLTAELSDREGAMSRSAECRDRAAQCLQLAATAGSALQRTVLLNAANSWIALADQAERDIAEQKQQDFREQQGNSRTAA
jgi:hypothetical protein